MTLPNKLTLLRILLIPIMVILYYTPLRNEPSAFFAMSQAEFWIALIFIVASITDYLDGYLARKNNQVTTFGKFADPLADKLLVMAALLLLVGLSKVPLWIVIVILSREFIVTGIRLVAVESGKVIEASNLGKYKTASTMLAIILLFYNEFGLKTLIGYDFSIANGVLYIALLLTIVSGMDYFYKNRHIILESI